MSTATSYGEWGKFFNYWISPAVNPCSGVVGCIQRNVVFKEKTTLFIHFGSLLVESLWEGVQRHHEAVGKEMICMYTRPLLSKQANFISWFGRIGL
jgi:hypothetical protein